MPEYGYMHLGRVISVESQGYSCEIITRAPGLRWGPVESMVAGLAVGERVVLAQLGESKDSLVIVGRLPGRTGLIGDIDGLQAALDAKLDDSQLDQASGVAALDSSRHIVIGRLPLGTTSSTVTVGNDARLSDARTPLAHHTTHSTGGTDAIAPADIGAATAAGLTTANANIATNTANIATNTSAIATANTTISGLTSREEFDGQKFFRLYGDAVTTMPRYQAASNTPLMSTGNAYAFTLCSARSITMLTARFLITSGGPTTTATASVYQGTTAGSPLSLVSSGPTAITPANGNYAFQCAPTASAFAVPAGFVVVIIQIVSGSIFTAGSATMDASMFNGTGGMKISAVKALTGTPPSTINTADGTWSTFGSMPWVALD
jgi:hypothetical protein